MFKKYLLFIFLLPFSLFSNSCYDIYGLKDENRVNSSIYILIDGTFEADFAMREQVYNNIKNLIHPNRYFYIAEFSAFIDNVYNKKIYDITIEDKMENSFFTAKSTLKKLNKCLRDQKVFAKSKLPAVIEQVLDKEKENMIKSEILFALKDFSFIIKNDKSKYKIVIILSDMLENSALTTFYYKNSLRELNPSQEIAKINENSMFADFGGANAYVIGAGLAGQGGYKNSKILEKFRTFWTNYFSKSNANLIEFGMPILKQDILIK